MFPPDLLQQLVLLLAPNLATFLAVFRPLLDAASTWCTIMVSPMRNWSAMARSFSRRRVGKRKRPRDKGGEADDLRPASQGRQNSSQRRPGHWARQQQTDTWS